MDGYENPTQLGKPRKRRDKRRTRAQLEHKLAVWKDRHYATRETVALGVSQQHRRWLDTSESDREKMRQQWERHPYMKPKGLRYGDDPYPHPGTPEGQLVIDNHWGLKTAEQQIEKTEKLLAALTEDKHG